LRGRSLVIFTDLDGTLLDHDTYGWGAAEPALNQCKRLNIPVVLVSSKTRAEMEVLRAEMDLEWPFVSENGGGMFFPPECPLAPPAEAIPCESGHVLRLGLDYQEIVEIFREIREELVLKLRGFSDMNIGEICKLTGLDPEGATLASKREYDEPFIVSGPVKIDKDALLRAAGKRGVQVTAGGRFFHLFGSCDKGGAVERLSNWFGGHYSNMVTVGLGDSANDIPMLRKVDIPVLIKSAESVHEMEDAIKDIYVTTDTGPMGWNRAVMDLLNDSINGGKP
jgi:mannosyl-3-phosphoglycerate phosphatase